MPVCFVLACPRLWVHSTLTPLTAHALSPSLSLRNWLPKIGSLAVTGEEGWALTSLLQVDSAQTPSPTRSHILSHPKTEARNDRIITNPDHPASPDMSQTQTSSQRCFFSCVSHARPDATTMQVTSHCHPVVTVWPASLTVSLHTCTYNLVPCKLFSSFQAHWEGGTKPEQSAHIGSPELPCQTQALTIAPHQPLATNPGVSDTIAHGCSLTPHSLLSHWRKTVGHWLFP